MSEQPDLEMGPPQPQGLTIPLVGLTNVPLRLDTMPDGVRCLIIGPIALGLPLSPEVEKWLTEQLNSSGIVIARAGDVPKLDLL